MDKVYFFFTKLNDTYEDELRSRDIFNESDNKTVDGELIIKKLGFNHSSNARISQLYCSEGRVAYQYLKTFENVLTQSYPLVFLVCDNCYRKKTDVLLESLFENFSEKSLYCYFHQSNTTIEKEVITQFGRWITEHETFVHEKGEPFIELISLFDVNSQDAFENKLEEIQCRFLGTDQKINERNTLRTKVGLLHKMLSQGYILEKEGRERIENFLSKDFIYDQSFEGLRQLRNHLFC